MCAHVKDRLLIESNTFVHFRVQECSFCFCDFSSEFDCRVKTVCLKKEIFYSVLLVFHIDMTSSMNLFQMIGFVSLCLSISFSILAIKILAKATAIFLPMAVP